MFRTALGETNGFCATRRKVAWCENCCVPILGGECEKCGNSGRATCADLRPVFAGEAEYLAGRLNYPIPNYVGELWARHTTLWWRGRRLLRLTTNPRPKLARIYATPEELLGRERVFEDLEDWVRALESANKAYLNFLEQEAIDFIRTVSASHADHMPIVSFSGGKDSSLVSYLVRRALGREDVLHIFGDTTIEFPDTYQFIRSFKKTNPQVPFREARAEVGWFDMCKMLGTPSRIVRWCCTVFKSVPIREAIDQFGRRVLNFEGIRRVESVRRRNRERINVNPKIPQQVSVEPIIDWRDVDVWAYIVTRRIPINDAYEKGFSRVGCLYCPMNNVHSENLIRYLAAESSDGWRDIRLEDWERLLLEDARFAGKDDPWDYVVSGAWKARGGAVRPVAYFKSYPCDADNQSFTVDCDGKEDGYLDFLVPFGRIRTLPSPEEFPRYAADGINGEPLFLLRHLRGRGILRITLLTERRRVTLQRSIMRQLRKWQVCVGCGACVAFCPNGAIYISQGRLSILPEKCTHCLRCTSTQYLKRGCVASHVLSPKGGRGY